jgi:hypothetical protein
MGNRFRSIYISIGFIICMVSPIFAAVLFTSSKSEVVEPLKNGEINWTLQTIRVTGSGAPSQDAPNIAAARLGAERAAKLDAMRNAIEAIQGVWIDSQTTVKNAMLESDIIRSRVQGFIQGARVVETKYLSDGAIQVTIEVPFKGPGGINDLLLPKQMGTKPVPKEGPAVYTGLIVDAKGLKVKPALSPKILDMDGREVYGSAFVSREYAIEQGIVGYAKDLSAAQQNERVATNPLIIKAIKAAGSGGSDLIISNDDANSLRDSSKNMSFLEKCRVMIVVD